MSTMKPEDIISRREIVIVSYQFEGVCNALRVLAATAAPIGASTRAIVAKLKDDFGGCLRGGKVLEGMPEVSEDMRG